MEYIVYFLNVFDFFLKLNRSCLSSHLPHSLYLVSVLFQSKFSLFLGNRGVKNIGVGGEGRMEKVIPKKSAHRV